MSDDETNNDGALRVVPGLWMMLEQAPSSGPPWEPPTSRAGSLPYEPTHEQAAYSSLLHACYYARLTESQTIEMLWRELRRYERQVQRLVEMQPKR